MTTESTINGGDIATPYRPRLNPAFVAKVRRKRAKEQKPIGYPITEGGKTIHYRTVVCRTTSDRAGSSKVADPRVKAIIDDVTASTGVTYEAMTGNTVRSEITKARTAAILHIHLKCPDLSYSDIGRNFGGKDHSFVRRTLDRAMREQAA